MREKKDPQRITQIKPSINKYNWEGINFPPEKDDWKIFWKNNIAIALNVLHAKTEKLYPASISKHNSNHEIQIILLMIPNGEARHYLAIKKLSALLRGIISKHHGGFYCLHCLILLQQKQNLNRMKTYLTAKIFVM